MLKALHRKMFLLCPLCRQKLRETEQHVAGGQQHHLVEVLQPLVMLVTAHKSRNYMITQGATQRKWLILHLGTTPAG